LTGKEIILQAIRGEKPSRTPASLLSGGAWTFNRRGYKLVDLLGKGPLAAEIISETAREIESDIVWPSSGYHNLLVHALGGKIIFREKGTMDVQEPLLKSTADLEKIDLTALQSDQWIGSIWEAAGLVAQWVGGDYLVGSSSWGPFTLAGQFYGVERIMSGLYKDQAAVKAVLDFTADLTLAYLLPFVRQGVAMISLAEPTASGDLISRRHFQEFVFPYVRKVAAGLKEEGALITLHICGNISDRLDLILEMGVDLLSLDYKVDVGLAKEVLGTKIAFAGNVNPVLLQNGSLEEVAKAAKECLAKGGADGNFVLMPGCDLPLRAAVENIHLFLRTGKEWSN